MILNYIPCNKQHIIDIMEIGLNITDTPKEEWENILLELIDDGFCKYKYVKGKNKDKYCMNKVKRKNDLFLYNGKMISLCHIHKFKLFNPKYNNYKNNNYIKLKNMNKINIEDISNDPKMIVNNEQKYLQHNNLDFKCEDSQNNVDKDEKRNIKYDLKENNIDLNSKCEKDKTNIDNKNNHKIDVNYHFSQKDAIVNDTEKGNMYVIPYIIKDPYIFFHDTPKIPPIYEETKRLLNINIDYNIKNYNKKVNKSIIKILSDFNNNILKNTYKFKKIIENFNKSIPICEHKNCGKPKQKQIIYFKYCNIHNI